MCLILMGQGYFRIFLTLKISQFVVDSITDCLFTVYQLHSPRSMTSRSKSHTVAEHYYSTGAEKLLSVVIIGKRTCQKPLKLLEIVRVCMCVQSYIGKTGGL